MTLNIQNLTKSYGAKKALDDVSMTLTSGVYGLLGSNGDGKSEIIAIDG